jgi:hypothetical protein
MVRNLRVAAATAVLILAAAVPASAQKSGGVLKIQHWDSPARHCQENRLLDRSGFGVGCGHSAASSPPAARLVFGKILSVRHANAVKFFGVGLKVREYLACRQPDLFRDHPKPGCTS